MIDYGAVLAVGRESKLQTGETIKGLGARIWQQYRVIVARRVNPKHRLV